jgi:hypothetical protein
MGVKSPIGQIMGAPLPGDRNHCTARGIAIGGEVVITTGSYTRMHFASSPGTAAGEIRGLPPVSLSLV